MSSATDALAIVKDAKKFEAQLAKLVKAEKSAKNAIDRANRKAEEIVAEARAVETKAAEVLAKAETVMAQARGAHDENLALAKGAKEESQRANSHEARIQKAKDKLAQDEAKLQHGRTEFSTERAEFKQSVDVFRARIKQLCDNVAG